MVFLVYKRDTHSPRAIHSMPVSILNKVYPVKAKKFSVFKRECPSKAKVEKVVKPPQKPVVSNSTWFWFSRLFFKERPNTMPISKQPIILTIKVPKKKF